MNCIIYYDDTQTYTNTVYDHLSCFGNQSPNNYFYYGLSRDTDIEDIPPQFDAVIIHYSIRVAFAHLSERSVDKLKNYNGIKVLFIQDEYDNNRAAKSFIKSTQIDLVMSVVPSRSIDIFYPSGEFPNTEFCNCLTGYVSSRSIANAHIGLDHENRFIDVGYRGRNLPLRYGELGRDKVRIGQVFKNLCAEENLKADIAWTEEERIYGERWDSFLANCRTMLGTESGCNVIDFEGDLDIQIGSLSKLTANGKIESEVEVDFVKKLEVPNLTNQISPRAFECAAAKTAMVLYEGEYSGVLLPDKHFIPVKKDHSNLSEVTGKIKDIEYCSEIAANAFRDIILTDKYSYKTFFLSFDKRLEKLVQHNKNLLGFSGREHLKLLPAITRKPRRSAPPMPQRHGWLGFVARSRIYPVLRGLFKMLPKRVRRILRHALAR